MIRFPKIFTFASADGEKTVPGSSSVSIEDEIYYENLISGQPYTVCGEIVLKENGKPGRQIVTGRYSFSPEESSGSVVISYLIDASGLAGQTVSALEEIRMDNIPVAEHRDPGDGEQTVRFSSLTGILRGENGEPVLSACVIRLCDRIRYSNLEEGREYLASGVLRCGGREITDEDGNPIVSEQFFTAGAGGAGELALSYLLDASVCAGNTVSSAVRIRSGAGVNACLEDEESTRRRVWIAQIDSSVDNGNGGRNVRSGECVSVIDRVSYAGLKPNREYRLKAILAERESGEPAGEAEILFRPEGSSGTVPAVISFASEEYIGKTLAVREELYDGDLQVAVHEDSGSAEQSVTVISDLAALVREAGTDLPIEGAEVRITDLTGGESALLTTDAEGKAYYPLTEDHRYSFRETKAPSGYILNPDTYCFTVNADGTAEEDAQTLYNCRTGTVVLRKTDVKTGKPVTGAVLSILDSEGNSLVTLETDRFGKAYFDASSCTSGGQASFICRELRSAEGYYPDEGRRKFTVSENGAVSGETDYVSVPYGTVTITKTDPEGNPLEGARLSFYTSAGRMIGQASTNSGGRVYFSAPEAGSYYFIEDQAPDGYARNDRKYEFSIDRYGRISVTTVFENERGGQKGVATGDGPGLFFWTLGFGAAGTALVILIELQKSRSTAAEKESGGEK